MSELTPLEADIRDVINRHFSEHDAHPQTVALAPAEMIPSLLDTLAWKPQSVVAAMESAEQTVLHLQYSVGGTTE